MKDKKIAIIGLDGANKTTAKLVGVEAQLHDFISTIPPYTPPAWTSILTGVNPAKHGIIGWQKVDRMSFKSRLATSRDVKYPRLPEILSSANMKSVIINLPMTYPITWADPENTIVVSDWMAPKQTIFPKKLEEQYREFLIDPPHQWWQESDRDEYADKVKEFTETRLSVYYDLLEKIDWNLYFIVFSETDWFSHWMPQILEGKDEHVVKPTFKLIREFINEVESIADIVFIVSDHGFQKIDKVFYINEALAQNGFIRYSGFKFRMANTAKKLIRRSNILAEVLYKLIPKSKISVNSMSYAISEAVAMLIESETWGLYLKNRENIKEVINALTDYPEIVDVVPSKLIHKGPLSRYLPDLFVIPAEGVSVSDELSGTITKQVVKGDHEIKGIFSFRGEGVKEDILFNKTPRVYDIVPTVLHIFGLPIPSDTDGRILKEIFEEDSELSKKQPIE
ncbi:alkaline phosphatase family protein [Thermococcus alcaliphilus]|uniref:alkaline phosphatase family protein n=1 Tax=Thermococcus alcaliphilus TaxID=139207 RepID=UPI00209032C5|nr:alkaline phosphatase family protein [Thermococcus alcaliphilus]MCO6042254.1 alkaline phosphatase family protein [Thermococcus alcaliphilus]